MRLLLRVLGSIEIAMTLAIVALDFSVKDKLFQLQSSLSNPSTSGMFLLLLPYGILVILAIIQFSLGYKSLKASVNKQITKESIKKLITIGLVLEAVVIFLVYTTYLAPILSIFSAIQ